MKTIFKEASQVVEAAAFDFSQDRLAISTERFVADPPATIA
jgi:hypothetical protein